MDPLDNAVRYDDNYYPGRLRLSDFGPRKQSHIKNFKWGVTEEERKRIIEFNKMRSLDSALKLGRL